MGYSIKEVLGFHTEYIQEVKSIRRKVWDDKEEPIMHDEILEGNGRPCKLVLTSWGGLTPLFCTMQQP